MCRHCGQLIQAIDAYIAKADSNLAATLGEEGYIKPRETVDAITKLEERVAAALVSETDYLIKAVKKADSLAQFQMDIWPKLKEGDPLQAALQTIFRDEFGAIVRRFAGLYFSAIENEGKGRSVTKASLKIVRVSKATTAWVENWSQELASIMQLNSHKEIESILTTGLENGIGIAEFARNIKNSGIRDEWYKARRVAVTEVLTAHRAGQQEAYLQSPATSAKMWRHTGIYIHQPRPNHKDMDGRQVPKDQPFELLGNDGHFYHPMFPGDPSLPPGERIECHCTTQGIVDENVLGLPFEERQRLQQEALDQLDEKWEQELEDRSKARVGSGLTANPPTVTIDREQLISAIQDWFTPQITAQQRVEFKAILDNMTDAKLRLYNQMSRHHARNLYHFTEDGAAYYPGERKVKMNIDSPQWERWAGTGQTAAWHTKFHEECHQLDHMLAEQGIDFDDLGGKLPADIYYITNTSTVIGKKLLTAIQKDIITVINQAVDERNADRVAIGAKPNLKHISSLARLPINTRNALIYWLEDHFPTKKDRALISLFTDAVGLATSGRITLYKNGFVGHKLTYNKERNGNGATSETFATFGSIFFNNNVEESAIIQQLMPSTWQIYSELFAMIAEMVANGGNIGYS